MYISSVEIHNFRSLKNVSVKLNEMNILIGPNNAGKTSFFEAINYAIGWNISKTPNEDDFFVADSRTFDPKNTESIEVILEFREGFNESERYSEEIETDFEGIIQYDEDAVKDGEEPIKFIRLKYTCEYSKEKNKFLETRIFLNQNNEEISGKDTAVRKAIHLSYFPFFYLETLRNIKSELRHSGSFWGKIKKSIDYSSKEAEITELIQKLENLLFQGEDKLAEVVQRLKEIEQSIKISEEPDNISLKAVSTRSWELLDGLTFYLKTADSNISLPIEKHGMGTQNIAIFTIFNAYLDILLPRIIENEEVTPIVGIEEPEAHVYPHSQRAIFDQITKIRGQKIISTHSPYIVDQASINDFLLFRVIDGETKINKIPKYKNRLKFGLPAKAYEANAYLQKTELHDLKRQIQFKNTELLFSSLFLMCEGDSEKIFFEMIAEKYVGISLGRLSVSVISCEGKKYGEFLKIVKPEAFNLPWLIFSDGEDDTQEAVKSTVLNNGYSEDHLEKNVLFLPSGMDFEAYSIRTFGIDVYKEIINQKCGEKALEKYKSQNNDYQSMPEEELINKFIDSRGKPLFGEYLAEYLLNNELELPSEINELFRRIKDRLNIGGEA
ncbi:AAA family ATPase [Radiobacillus kanasensis]|uniref:ATP-dependent nuclease n=1 Tax=Radiobacillus kanasensis TaxID=2844358 RepID=UPI001E339504|nr:AAA family ATPase [Radiobacillus kanasensis]UFU00842.1 AAA family ATPase [Radiobacillus kanasensis]